jgi:hypothetical protein
MSRKTVIMDAGTPRWVKVFAVITVVVIALIAVLLIVGGDEHGPGRHASSDRRLMVV